MNTITKLEMQVLRNIASSEYISAKTLDQLVNHSTWSFVATNSEKALTGALGSCVKKGLAGADGSGQGPTCWLTKKGVEYLKQSGFCLNTQKRKVKNA